MDIYVQKDGQQQGPFAEVKVRQGIDAGEFDPRDLAWMTGKASWQPLSSLINLDMTKPPPLISVPVPPPLPAVSFPLKAGASVHETPPTASVPTRPVPVSGRDGQRACKKCGAPYKLLALNRAMGSGLCTSCTPKRDEFSAFDSTPITSATHALKTVRTAGIFFLAVSVFDVLIGVSSDAGFLIAAVIYFACGLAVWIAHSRVAAIVLIIYLAIGILYNLAIGNMQAFMGAGIFLFLLQIGVTAKATQAVFMLNNKFKANS